MFSPTFLGGETNVPRFLLLFFLSTKTRKSLFIPLESILHHEENIIYTNRKIKYKAAGFGFFFFLTFPKLYYKSWKRVQYHSLVTEKSTGIMSSTVFWSTMEIRSQLFSSSDWKHSVQLLSIYGGSAKPSVS